MPGAAPNPNPQYRQAHFDENGGTTEEALDVLPADELSADEPADPDESLDENEADAPEPIPAAGGKKKYRIGDMEFDTQEEAYAYASREVEAANAYQRGANDALSAVTPQQNVTPDAAPAFDAEKYYADPEAFLKEFAQKITNQTVQTIQQTQEAKAADEAAWAEFVNRHPDLAEFKTEIGTLAQVHFKELVAMNRLKGKDAGYDFIALKMKTKLDSYRQAQKPTRALNNGGGSRSAPAGARSVTPPAAPKKPLSMIEQIKTLRKNQA